MATKSLRIPWRRVEGWLKRLVLDYDPITFEPTANCGCVLAKFYDQHEGRPMFFDMGRASENQINISKPEYATDSKTFEKEQIRAAEALGRDLTAAEALLILQRTR